MVPVGAWTILRSKKVCYFLIPKSRSEKQEKPMEECEFLGEESLKLSEAAERQKWKHPAVWTGRSFPLWWWIWMRWKEEDSFYSNDKKERQESRQSVLAWYSQLFVRRKNGRKAERKAWFVENFDFAAASWHLCLPSGSVRYEEMW